MPLDHCTFANPRETKALVALDRSPEGAVTLISSRDGPVRRIRSAKFPGSMLPSESRKFTAPVDALTEPERRGFSLHVELRHWSDAPTSDLWDSPVTQAQRKCQQAVTIVLAFVLAALLGQLGL